MDFDEVPTKYKWDYLAAVEGRGGNDLAKFRMMVHTMGVKDWDSANANGKGAMEYSAINDGPHGAPVVGEEGGPPANNEGGLNGNEFGPIRIGSPLGSAQTCSSHRFVHGGVTQSGSQPREKLLVEEGQQSSLRRQVERSFQISGQQQASIGEKVTANSCGVGVVQAQKQTGNDKGIRNVARPVRSDVASDTFDSLKSAATSSKDIPVRRGRHAKASSSNGLPRASTFHTASSSLCIEEREKTGSIRRRVTWTDGAEDHPRPAVILKTMTRNLPIKPILDTDWSKSTVHCD